MRKAVFLDKDGTLVEDLPYNVDPDRMTLGRGVLPGLRALAGTGYRLVVVSNQSGVARGLFGESALQGVERGLRSLLQAGGVVLDGFYYCPHHPDARLPDYRRACTCRKPQPGLLERAAVELGLSLADSWMVGDILDDVEAGHRAGCRAVLVDNGGETEWIRSPARDPDIVVKSFDEAAVAILAADRRSALGVWLSRANVPEPKA
jgi:histidinol-phosphate phosphatase family protein